jgi:hypothetical protein
MTEHMKGILITALGALMVVPDSLFVRLIQADPVTITFWRATIAGSLIFVGRFLIQGLAGLRAVCQTSWPGALYIALMSTTAPEQAMPSQWQLVLGRGAFIVVSTCLLTLGPVIWRRRRNRRAVAVERGRTAQTSAKTRPKQ